MFGTALPEFLSHVLHDSLLLLAVINPLGNIPVYVSLTQGMKPAERRNVFNLAVSTAAGLVVFFAIVGDYALRDIFQVTLADFQVAGGILLFVVAARGVLTTQSRYSSNGQDYESIALFPLAFPIIVGPGTMAVTILIAQQTGRWNVLATASLTFLIVWMLVHGSPHLNRALGRLGGLIIARVLYIFLAAKAAALCLAGLRAALWGG